MSTPHSSDRPVILLLEESNPHCDLLQAILAEHLFLVIRARDAHEARTISRDCPVPFHLLLTRIRLRSVSGPDLARYLRIRSPSMAVLYLAESLAEMMELTDPEEFLSSLLPNPFSPEVLVHRVKILVSAVV